MLWPLAPKEYNLSIPNSKKRRQKQVAREIKSEKITSQPVKVKSTLFLKYASS
jgi:hypothetical protein